MSAPVLWIITPGVIAAVLLVFTRFHRLPLILGIACLTGLAGLAYLLPIGETISLGPISIELSDTLFILGRHFTLSASSRYTLILIYLLADFWFIGGLAAGVAETFAPLALAMVALLVAALAVDPFLYAALLIEVAVLVSIPLLAPPGQPVRQGVLRYLIFQTLAMPFILFTGWMLSGLEAGHTDPGLTMRASALLGIGFTFLLAVFPFYSWIPLVGEQNHPYVVGFVLLMQPTVVLLFGLEFLNQYAWLRENPLLYELLRVSGVIMIVTGGLWAAFQKHLGRMYAYAAISETGWSLLALGIGLNSGLPIFSMMFLPRLFGMGVWALALSQVVEQAGNLSERNCSGLGRKDPILASCLLVGQLSIVGLPLFAGFPVRFALLQGLASLSPALTAWVLVGMLGLFGAALRTMQILFIGEDWKIEFNVPWPRYVLLLGAVFVIMLVGLLPQWFFPVFTRLSLAYSNLLP